MYKTKLIGENLFLQNFKGVGKYNIPQILPTDFYSEKFIGFNYAKTKQEESSGIHFFLDDYQFERLWNRPEHYIPLLKKFGCVLSPDFSLFTDFPVALQIYNHYRKHWLAAYWQQMGINVVPTLCWSDRNSFEWCFDGEPERATVAISSIGTQKSQKSKEMFLCGYKEMIERLHPKNILFYGIVPDECQGNIIQIEPFQSKFKKIREKGAD